VEPVAPARDPETRPPITLDRVPGWETEDHAAALALVAATCRDRPRPALELACGQAQAAGPLTAPEARRLLETLFRAQPLGESGLLTAYFSPQYEVRFFRTGEFTAPVRPRPADLEQQPDARPDPARPGWKGEGRQIDGQWRPYDDRSLIEAREETQPLGWMRAEDLFFLQIQGSGTLVLPDGRRKRAVFVATNGLPFKGIATPMRDQGLLPADGTSGEAIRSWLAAHRGPEADAIMRLNPRYVFFRMEDDDGTEPVGAGNIPLTAGRTIAVDPLFHQYGDLYWLDGRAPALAGAFPRYSRLVAALDTGGAIRGPVRADLYMGRGDAPGAEAGRVTHGLALWRLVPAPDLVVTGP
jgi:membrane-bound lytic murein transglycosylase A